MSPLAPDLFRRRFQDFMDIGRARLQSLSPEWTDHNAHDPGITLMELLAWVGEAQLYSLSRLRRDERSAYAALLGVSPQGTRAARGLIWPDRLDPESPEATFLKTLVIPESSVINVWGVETPTFRPTHNLLWTPGRIEKLESRRAKGKTTDHTVANQRGGAAFLPFGERAGSRDILTLTFLCRDDAGLYGGNRLAVKGALWSIGILAAPSSERAAKTVESTSSFRSALSATLVAGDQRIPLKIESDSTSGLLSTGVLLLNLDQVGVSPKTFSIELRSSNGFARPPRWFQIRPNVIPIQQGRTIADENQVSNGLPDWSFQLAESGLRFDAGKEPLTVEVLESSGRTPWSRTARLADCGPEETVFEFDDSSGTLTFGNGINGLIPPAGSKVLVSYAVSDGEEGRVARNRKWAVEGFAGVFGINPDPIGGGSGRLGWLDQRREARRRSREDHALVSMDDIASAAKALPLLEVSRAWVELPSDAVPRTGILTLIALRRRPQDVEPEGAPETSRWLTAIHRRLVSRMPLGTRLVVKAPRYVEFTIQAEVEVEFGRKPDSIEDAIRKQLRNRLSLDDSDHNLQPRQPGVPVTFRDLGAWIRATDGVKRVTHLQLLNGEGKDIDDVAVRRHGLPRWIEIRSTIKASRPSIGASR